MELFFIVCFLGLLALGIFYGGKALVGKGCMIIIVIVFGLWMCHEVNADLDEQERHHKEAREKLQEEIRVRDSIGKIEYEREKKEKEQRMRKTLGDKEYERIYGKSDNQ